MPIKPKKIDRSYMPERKPFERANNNQEFYNSWAWRKARKLFLSKNPICKMCDDEGVVEPATVVDHIVRIEKGGDEFNESNLQSLCEKHHNSKSGSEAHY